MSVLIGQIQLFPYVFAPKGWLKCDGSLMSTSEHPALFSLLGTTYGGDGRDTFALPDLRGRTPIGSGRGPGLPEYILGEKGVTGLKLEHPTDIPAVGIKGKKMDNESLDRANDVKVTPYLALNWCIAIDGVYPSRG